MILVGQEVNGVHKYFASPAYWNQIFAEKEGTGQPNMNGKKLANLIVPIPPIPDQERIVSYLNDIDAKTNSLKQLQAESAVELNALLPTILDQAFRGEL
jgi:type I restriction enzyme, S subunit